MRKGKRTDYGTEKRAVSGHMIGYCLSTLRKEDTNKEYADRSIMTRAEVNNIRRTFGSTDYGRTTRARVRGGQMRSYESIGSLQEDTEESHAVIRALIKRYGRGYERVLKEGSSTSSNHRIEES